MNQDKDTFNFFVPIELVKSDPSDPKDPKSAQRFIQGIASTDDKDLQGERVLQEGLDLSYFLAHGWLNDNHTSHKVGEAVDAKITKAGFWLKGLLYKGDDKADYYWNLMNNIEASGGKRKCGFSIEGKITRRNGSTIQRAWIQNVALTTEPVNTHTYAEIAKSLSKEKFCDKPWLEHCSCEENSSCDVGSHADSCACTKEEKALSAGGMGAVLRPQSLEGSNKVTTYKGQEILTLADAVQYLQLQKGYSRKTAEAIADAVFTENGVL